MGHDPRGTRVFDGGMRGVLVLAAASAVCLLVWYLAAAERPEHLIKGIQVRQDIVYDVCWGPRENSVGAAAGKGVVLLDLGTGRERWAVPHPGWQGPCAIAYSDTTAHIVAAYRDGSVCAFEASSGTESTRFETGPHDGISVQRAISLSMDGSLVAVAGGENQLDIWDVWSAQRVQQLERPGQSERRCTALCFSPDASYVVGATDAGEVCIWSSRTGESERTFREAGEVITAIALSKDNQLLLAGTAKGILLIWDCASGRRLRRMSGQDSSVTCVAISTDGRRGLSGGHDGMVRLWDLSGGAQLGRFPVKGDNSVMAVAFSADGTLALSGGGYVNERIPRPPGEIRLWSIQGERDEQR